MLLVKTRIATSPIHGLGLFADQDIPAGTPTWRFHPGVDIRIPPETAAALPPAARDQLARYAYRCQDTGDHVLCADDARFFNHADEPNTICVQDETGAHLDIAARDIAAGEELTCDYRAFDADWRSRLATASGAPATGASGDRGAS